MSAITNLQLHMPADDYTAAAGGGLRLKGVAGSKITKHKKKRPKQPETEKQSSFTKPDAEASEPNGQDPHDERQDEAMSKRPNGTGDEMDNRVGSVDRSEPRGKTEAELRHDEQRRMRVCSRSPFSLFPTRRLGADVMCVARGTSQARRHQDAQGEGRGIQSLPEQPE